MKVNSNQSSIKNSLFSVLQILFTTLCYGIVYYTIINNLGKEILGAWSIITSIPIAISVFGSGVSGCILRYIPVYSAKKDALSFNQIVFSGIVVNVGLAIIIALICYIFSNDILSFLFNKKNISFMYLELFRISLAVFFFNFVASVLSFTLDGLQYIHIRNKIIIVGSFIFCTSSFFLIKSLGIAGIIYSQLLQSLVVFCLLSYYVLKTSLFDFKLLSFRRKYLNLFLNYGQGFQIISITLILFDPITKYFINSLFNLSIVGIYDLINRIITQARTLIVSAIQVITPEVSKRNEEGNLNISLIYNKINRGATLLSLCVLSTGLNLGIIALKFTNSNNIKLYFSMSILMVIAYHFNIITSTSYSILMGLGKLKHIVVSHIMSTVLNILLFETLKYYLSNIFIVLPICISIILSSSYLIINFRYTMKVKPITKILNDKLIFITCCSTSIITGVLTFTNASFYSIALLGIIHISLLVYLVFKNDFFITLFNKIFNLKFLV